MAAWPPGVPACRTNIVAVFKRCRGCSTPRLDHRSSQSTPSKACCLPLGRHWPAPVVFNWQQCAAPVMSASSWSAGRVAGSPLSRASMLSYQYSPTGRPHVPVGRPAPHRARAAPAQPPAQQVKLVSISLRVAAWATGVVNVVVRPYGWAIPTL